MAPDKQRIAIAKFCGWTHDYPNLPTRKGTLWVSPSGAVNHCCCFPDFPSAIPDYPNDRDAMYEVMKRLSYKQAQEVADYILPDIMVRDGMNCPADDFLYHASAAQEAEALLKVLGLWKEQ